MTEQSLKLTIATLFDLRRTESRAKLLDLVGPDIFSQIEKGGGRTFVAVVMDGPDRDPTVFNLDGESKLVQFYRDLVRMEKEHPEDGRIEVIPAELAPETRKALIDAGVLFALERATPYGSA